MGGSNGGLLMGATLTQHPASMRAVVSQVGIYDMLRWETQPNGAFNVTEFGTVKDPDAVPRAVRLFAAATTCRDGDGYPGGAAHQRATTMAASRRTSRAR